MAAYNGNSSKAVSSSYLYTTLQNFYTKIKGLLDQKITNNPFAGGRRLYNIGFAIVIHLLIHIVDRYCQLPNLKNQESMQKFRM